MLCLISSLSTMFQYSHSLLINAACIISTILLSHLAIVESVIQPIHLLMPDVDFSVLVVYSVVDVVVVQYVFRQKLVPPQLEHLISVVVTITQQQQ